DAFRGWCASLTIYSVEWNITPDGNPKVYLNTADLNKLVEDMGTANFPQEWINFIVAYRQVGPSQSTTTVIGTGNSPAAANTTPTATTQPTGELNMDLQAQKPHGGILELVRAAVQYTFSMQPAPA